MSDRMRASHPFRNKGEKHPAAKLTDSHKAQIREAHGLMGVMPKTLADQYGVCVNTIYRVLKQ